jgi:type I restriction enzyme S subunit
MTENYKLVRLGEICEISTGSTDTKDATENGQYPLFDRSKKIKTSDKYLFDCEALIMPGEGAEFLPRHYIGKFDLHQRAYAMFNFSGLVNPKYLHFYLIAVKDYFAKNAVGATVKSLRRRHFTDLEVPLPSLEKQAETVEKLDSAFAEIDALGKGITARIENTSELFAKICTKKTQELNPTAFKSLREIATVITKGTTPTSLGYKFTSSGINFLKVESLDENGSFIRDKFAYINSDCHASLKRSQLEESDVLVSIAGALGRTAIVTTDICPANVNQALSLIRLPKDSEISPKFLFALFQAGYFKFELDQMGAGAAQQNLSLAQIGSLKVPIFPEVKQLEFIDFLIKLRELVTNLKNHLENQNILKLELKNSILTTTFYISSDNELVA